MAPICFIILLSPGASLGDDNILRDRLHHGAAGQHVRHRGDHQELGSALRHELLSRLPRPGGHSDHHPR